MVAQCSLKVQKDKINELIIINQNDRDVFSKVCFKH